MTCVRFLSLSLSLSISQEDVISTYCATAVSGGAELSDDGIEIAPTTDEDQEANAHCTASESEPEGSCEQNGDSRGQDSEPPRGRHRHRSRLQLAALEERRKSIMTIAEVERGGKDETTDEKNSSPSVLLQNSFRKGSSVSDDCTI